MSKSLTFIEHDCENLRKVIITNYADIVEQFYRNKMFIDNFEYVQNGEKSKKISRKKEILLLPCVVDLRSNSGDTKNGKFSLVTGIV
jgi:hypothetical protein